MLVPPCTLLQVRANHVGGAVGTQFFREAGHGGIGGYYSWPPTRVVATGTAVALAAGTAPGLFPSAPVDAAMDAGLTFHEGTGSTGASYG